MITAHIITTFAQHATTKEEMGFVDQLAKDLVGQDVLGLGITSAKVTSMSSELTNGDWHEALQLEFAESANDDWGWRNDVKTEVVLSRMIESKSPARGITGTSIILDIRVSSGHSRPIEEAQHLRAALECK